MSAPMNIRSSSSSRSSMSELLNFQSSPPFVSDRHACAFPSWPDRPNLRCPPTMTQQTQSSSFFSDSDLSNVDNVNRRYNRLRRPSNYLSMEFEDDSSDESNESTPNGTPEVGTIKAKTSSSKSALGDQLRREKCLKNKAKRYMNAVTE